MVIAWLSLFVPPESVPGRVILIIHLYLQHHGHPYDGYYHCPWQSELNLHLGHLGRFIKPQRQDSSLV